MTNAEKARGARAIVRALIRDKRLSSDARMLWLLIESFADKDGTNAFPSQDTLAELAGKEVRWVRKYLEELEAAERIAIHKRPCSAGAMNVYTLLGGKKCTFPVAKRKVTKNVPQLGDIKCTPTGIHIPGAVLPGREQYENRVLNGAKKRKLPHIPSGHAHHDADEQPLETRTEP